MSDHPSEKRPKDWIEGGRVTDLWEAPLGEPPDPPDDLELLGWTPDPEDDPLWPGAETPCERCGQRYSWNFRRGTWECDCDDEDKERGWSNT